MDCRAAQFNKWLETPLGQRLLNTEATLVGQILPKLFGYHLLQIGDMGRGCLLENSRIMHRCLLNPVIHAIPKPFSQIGADVDNLPITPGSIDVVVLPHILEFAEHPHAVLREIERVLIPEGYIIILGFNPRSLWGVCRWFLARRGVAPWCGRFISLLRLKDWLALLGFEIVDQQSTFFALPLHNDRLARYTTLLEKISTQIAWKFGAIYFVVARKRVATLTPIKPRWLTKPTLTPTGIVGSGCKKL
ncbi:MAG: hypothetical protein BWK79_04170 [Beggiatoa sp. IS2]|nr:MAG: hypothetical protein BWK79_04170 [Beggiatoa sp. IS2]